MIVSLFAGSQRFPVGGVTSRYEYANALARMGHEVHLVHFSWFRPCITSLEEVNWFRFEEGVVHHFAAPDGTLTLPDADFINDVHFARRHGLPFQFFQGIELYGRRALRSFVETRCPTICIAEYLVDEAVAHGVPRKWLVHIPHGIDHSKYKILAPLELRPVRAAMLQHTAEIKGTAFGVAALEHAKREVPELEVVLFGTQEPVQSIPDWMDLRRSPDQHQLVRDIYNRSRVFVCPSLWGEGFGKTQVEAMACGCALVTTANGGSGDFALHGETALVSEPRDVETMARHIVTLLRDDELRIALAQHGHAYVQRFSWDASARKLAEFLERYRENPGSYMEPLD